MLVPNILFCYFAHSYQHYIPLDVGYAIAQIKNGKTKANCFATRLGADTDENLLKKIKSYNPDAVFFFTDHLLWAGANYYEDAKRLAQKLDAFVGVVSNKEESAGPGIGILVPADNEYAFRHLDLLLIGKLPESQKPTSLDDLPSPYLAGIFDRALRHHAKSEGFSPFIFSSKGCMHRCHYCFRSVREDRVRFFSPERFYDEIEYLLRFGVGHFHLLDDCFVFSKGRTKAFAREFDKRKRYNSSLGGISCKAMCRLDKLDPEMIDLLKHLRINIVQLGLQTLNPKLSHYMGRNLSQNKISDSIDELNRNGFTVQIDLMLGLPHDTYEYFRKSMEFAIPKNPQRIQVRQLYLSKGTLFYEKRKEYGFRTKSVQDGLNIVTSAAGFDFKEKAYQLLKKSVEEHPEIKWMWTTDEGPSSRLLPKEMLL